MAAQTKKSSMTTETASKISKNPNKKKQILHSDESKQQPSARTLFGFVWSRSYRLPPHGVAKDNETEIFDRLHPQIMFHCIFIKVRRVYGILNEWEMSSHTNLTDVIW